MSSIGTGVRVLLLHSNSAVRLLGIDVLPGRACVPSGVCWEGGRQQRHRLGSSRQGRSRSCRRKAGTLQASSTRLEPPHSIG
jgi:hypothetical protein